MTIIAEEQIVKVKLSYIRNNYKVCSYKIFETRINC